MGGYVPQTNDLVWCSTATTSARYGQLGPFNSISCSPAWDSFSNPHFPPINVVYDFHISLSYTIFPPLHPLCNPWHLDFTLGFRIIIPFAVSSTSFSPPRLLQFVLVTAVRKLIVINRGRVVGTVSETLDTYFHWLGRNIEPSCCSKLGSEIEISCCQR